MAIANLKMIKSFGHFVQLMVDGLNKRHTGGINMTSFGEYHPEVGVCFGCAATNALCELSGVKFGKRYERHRLTDKETILENAWDSLRRGYDGRFDDGSVNNIKECLLKLKLIEKHLGFKVPEYKTIASRTMYRLEELDNWYWEKRLKRYETYANWLLEKRI